MELFFHKYLVSFPPLEFFHIILILGSCFYSYYYYFTLPVTSFSMLWLFWRTFCFMLPSLFPSSFLSLFSFSLFIFLNLPILSSLESLIHLNLLLYAMYFIFCYFVLPLLLSLIFIFWTRTMFSFLEKFWKVHALAQCLTSEQTQKQILLIVLLVFSVSIEVFRSVIWPVPVSVIVKGEGSSSACLLPFKTRCTLAFSPLISVSFCSTYFIMFEALWFLFLVLLFIVHRSLFYLYSISEEEFSKNFQNSVVDHFQSITPLLSVLGMDVFLSLLILQWYPNPVFVHRQEPGWCWVSSHEWYLNPLFRATHKGMAVHLSVWFSVDNRLPCTALLLCLGGFFSSTLLLLLGIQLSR